MTFTKTEKKTFQCALVNPDIMNGHCTNCGHEVSMGGNFMLSDYDETVTDEDDNKMNFVLNQCPYCGMQEVRWDCSENEKKIYPYWKEEKEEENGNT